VVGQKILNFPRKLAPFFLQYISERPEMTSPWRAGASAKAAKREIKEGQNKRKEKLK
jgi:hypothetical protein